MIQSISITLSRGELTEIIGSAVSAAIDKKMSAVQPETLYTVGQAIRYMNCSSVFLWKLRKQGKILSTNAGKKILIPKSSIDSYLNLKKGGNK